MLKDDAMAGLCRLMGSDEIIINSRAKSVGYECRRSGDEAVQHHGPTCKGAAEYHARQHAYLVSANLVQHVQTIGWDRVC